MDLIRNISRGYPARAAVVAALAACWPAAAAAQDASPIVSSEQPEALQVAAGVLDRLNAAWNAGDGARFGDEFTEDADIINIFGEPYKGRADLVRRMQFIFEGIFKDSRHVGREIEVARYLDVNTILVVASAHIAVPAGPMSPETRNRQTLILTRVGGDWLIRHWHNTTVGRPNQS